MNYALEARVEIALHRVLLDVNPLQAWRHYKRAQCAAAMAYDLGQADSPLLVDETWLVISGCLARDAESPPLTTKFASWLTALDEAVPSAGIGQWAENIDKLSISQLMDVGDAAADFTASMRYNSLNQTAAMALGHVWEDCVKTTLERTNEFSDLACKRAEVALEHCGWRIMNIGYAAIGAVAERVLISTRPDTLPQTSMMWFSEIFARYTNDES